MIATSAIHDKKLSNDTLDNYLNLIKEHRTLSMNTFNFNKNTNGWRGLNGGGLIPHPFNQLNQKCFLHLQPGVA